jgi:hypothetical protein
MSKSLILVHEPLRTSAVTRGSDKPNSVEARKNPRTHVLGFPLRMAAVPMVQPIGVTPSICANPRQ